MLKIKFRPHSYLVVAVWAERDEQNARAPNVEVDVMQFLLCQISLQ